MLLGFSERFFNQLGDQAERVIAGDADQGSAAAAGSPTSSFQPFYRPDGQPNGAAATTNGAAVSTPSDRS